MTSPPDAPDPGPRFDRERLVVVAHADADTAKSVADALESWGLEALVAHDGVEAMLGIQRALPRAVVLDAALPKMYGFQVCEIVKRNESLRETRVVLVGAIHKEERYRRAPRDLYGADVYVEPPDLPDALLEILTRFGLPVRADAAASPHSARPDAPYGHVTRGGSTPRRESRTEPLLSEPAPEITREPPAAVATTRSSAQGGRPASGAAVFGGGARSEPKANEVDQDVSEARQVHRKDGLEGRPSDPSANLQATSATPAQAKPAPAPPADPLTAERAKAERLARIIVSDIVLYNPEKFAAAARAGGDVAAAMRDELEEGRALFRERIDAQVRAERDHLAEELARAAKARSGQ
jgi:CheY-like chemotaxis protein